ncbi:uncharacterized protein F4807DRAFT_442365 [Annulohypoxylon truncatum]|uniref:uncharacterized protein n=1 Tax=Annulohypoxylon truncatum TaxID=327061 RepID=UPI002008DC44|nr:uncharacterized protein F4807DRAFT_442365 [Annulohypoxylon truncatum]KAI1205601.1 hypothetical protein F4807DRAFT_442365 [Annulohypoxylon truncatum]
MTSDVNVSRRPSLEPIWTNYRSHGSLPNTVYRPTPINASLSPSPLSPKSLPGPSPVHPASYDKSMRKQDRALVDSFDQRTRHVVNTAPLTPIDEYSPSPLVARLEKISILPPMSISHGLPTPASPSIPPRRDSLNALERSGSLSGMSGPQDRSPGYYTRDVSPVSPRRNSVSGVHDQLRSWGHVYYGNAKTADAFIIARSLRRRSSGSPTEVTRPAGASMKNRLTVRAIVRPRALDRPSFLIQRNFDIDELRATIPDPPPQSQISGSPNEWRRPSLPSILSSGTPPPAQPRSRRSSSVRSGALLRSGTGSIDLDSLVRDARAVPVHLKYVRAYLPVVAALLVSGHIHEGDVVYLPMPHAESWPQTAQYVYTGQGELTEAIKENILYLAGKV